MTNLVQVISLDKLFAHPDNPNTQNKSVFAKLVRNIERTGRYEPILVRVHPEQAGDFQIINGHHRCKALEKLGRSEADCIVWEVDDEQTDILLSTLNRLTGSDIVSKKIAILKRLRETITARDLAKLMPQTSAQIERLANLKPPKSPAENKSVFAEAVTFFLNAEQFAIVNEAVTAVLPDNSKPKAQRRAEAITAIAEGYISVTANEYPVIASEAKQSQC